MRRSPPIEPVLGWACLPCGALECAKAQMDEESMDVRDEIGFLTIHQRYADRFFPGTSVLRTRARYALLVPWLFEDGGTTSGHSVRRQPCVATVGGGAPTQTQHVISVLRHEKR